MNQLIAAALIVAVHCRAQGIATSVVPWGINNSGQNQVPAGLTNIVAVAEGSDFSLALKADGTVISWGLHWNGYRYVPITIPENLTNVVAIAAGYDFSVALKDDGTVVAWGENVLGQASVPANLRDVVAIAVGYGHTVALKSDGSVAAWGHYDSPAVPFSGNLTNVSSIGAGLFHGLAVKEDGTVVQWGNYCNYGDLNVPAHVTNVIAVAGGCMHSLALKNDGRVLAWGGNGSASQIVVPTAATNVVAIAGGETHSLALTDDGRVLSWGRTDGPGPPVNLSNVIALAAGWHHSVALVGRADPSVVREPSSKVVSVGSDVFVHPLVIGRPPLRYQWQFEGADLREATNAWLSLKSVALNASGRYRVLVSNAFGSTTSQVATLTVCDLAISSPNLDFEFEGGLTNINVTASSDNCPWQVVNSNTWLGVASMRNGVGNDNLAWFVTPNRSPDSRNGTITVGGQVITIEQKGVPQQLLPKITKQPKSRIVKKAGGRVAMHVAVTNRRRLVRPISYQWCLNGNPIPGANRAKLILKHVQPLDAGEYFVVVSSRFGEVVSATASVAFRGWRDRTIESVDGKVTVCCAPLAESHRTIPLPRRW